MKYLLSALVSLVVLDGLVTELLLERGLAREGNPLLEPIVGEVGFIALKVLGALVCALILWDVYRRFPRIAKTVASLAVTGYGVIVLWNSSLFLLS